MSAVPGLSWFNAPAWLPLVHALLHTLWQGALLAGGLLLALRLVPARRASLRYGLSTAAFALVLLLGLGSWALLDVAPRPRPAAGTGSAGNSPASATGRVPGHPPARRPAAILIPNEERTPPRVPGGSAAATGADAAGFAQPWVGWAAVFWLLGTSVCLLRAAGGVSGAGRLRRRCRNLADPRILVLAEELRGRLRLSGRVRFLVSEEVGVPAVMGVLWPAVLLPATLLTGVPVDQLRAILAHELAHIRRGDYLVNLAQMLVEALLFFNPFVWWIGRQMRLEREACCDQLAAEECQSPAHYVEALVAVIERSRPAAVFPAPILAASGPRSHGDALDRARRLLVPGYQPTLRMGWSSLVAVLALSGLVLGGLWLGTRAVAQTIKTAEPPATPAEAPKAEPAIASVGFLAAEAQSISDQLLAAARTGDAQKVLNLLTASESPPAKFSTEETTRMLADLLRNRELAAFTTLHDELKKTHYGKDWQISGEELASLVKDGRTDFLDALLAHRLKLDRLSRLAASAAPPTTEWITRRVAEVGKRRADLEALETASASGDLAAMQRLLDAGADVNGVGKDDNTPLIRAVYKDRLEAAQFLLDHGAQVDKPRFPGWDYTPLCLVNSVPMAELLKKNGANIHAKLWKRDVSILDYVAMFGKPEVVEWFLQQGLDPKMIGDNNENLLFSLKDGRTAELLLAAGVNPNQVNTSGVPPICSAGSAAVAQALIEHGARVTGFKEPLLLRMQSSSAGALEAVLKAGAEHDPDMLQQALIGAAHMDHSEITQVLIRYGAKPNGPGFWNREKNMKDLPLEVCCIFGSEKTAKVLLAAGADPNAEVPSGPGPMLKIAMHNGYKELAVLLRQSGARGVSDLAFAVATHDQAGVATLLANAPTYAENPVFWADVLSSAARIGDVATVRVALAKGAPMALEQSAHGNDAYSAAAWEGQDEALALLLATRKPGDDPKELSGALWSAVWNCHPYENQRSVEHFEKCVRILLDAGAAVNGNDGEHHKYNLLYAAVFSRYPGGNPQVIEMLVRAGADPNPLVPTEANSETRLLDAVQVACAKGYCSTPVAETLIKLSRFVPSQPDRSPVPATTPAPTPRVQDSPPAVAPPGVGETTTPTPSPAPPLTHQLTVTPEIKKAFPSDDGIEIRQITGSAANFQTGGTYRITGVCRQQTLKNATLYIGNTAEAGSDAIAPVAGSSLYKTLPNGSTEFDFTFQLLRPGVLHVTIYDLDNHDKYDNAYAGIYLGKVAAAEEIPPVPPEHAASPLPESRPPLKSAGALPDR